MTRFTGPLRLKRCRELAIEASTKLHAVRNQLPEAPPDWDDTDTSLPAQLARVNGLVDDVVDASEETDRDDETRAYPPRSGAMKRGPDTRRSRGTGAVATRPRANHHAVVSGSMIR